MTTDRAHDVRRIEIYDDYIPMYELAVVFCLIVILTHVQAILSVLSGYITAFCFVVFLLYGDQRRKKKIKRMRDEEKAKRKKLQARQSSRVDSWVKEQAHHVPAWTASPRLRRSDNTVPIALGPGRDHTEERVSSHIDGKSRSKIQARQVSTGLFEPLSPAPILPVTPSPSPTRFRSVSAPASPRPSTHSGVSLPSMESTVVASTPSPVNGVGPLSYRPTTPFKVWRDDSLSSHGNDSLGTADPTSQSSSDSCYSALSDASTSRMPSPLNLRRDEISRVHFSDPAKPSRPLVSKGQVEAWKIAGNPTDFKLRGPLLLKKNSNRWEWKDKDKSSTTRFSPAKGYRRAIN